MEPAMTIGTVRGTPWAQRIADYWALTKTKQTALLLFTGLCGYLLTHRGAFDPAETTWMSLGLFLSISGCTALNMLLDRDMPTVSPDDDLKTAVGHVLKAFARRLPVLKGGKLVGMVSTA